MMQREVKRIHVVQAGLLLGVLYAALGLLFGLFYGLAGLLFGVIGASSSSGSSSGTGSTGAMEIFAIAGGLGLFAIIVFPLLYGAMGFICGMIGALMYNLAAKIIGGFKFDVVDISMTRHQIEADQAAIGTGSIPPPQA